MGYTEVHTLDQRIRDAQLMLKKLKEYRNAARRYTTPAVSNKCSKSVSKPFTHIIFAKLASSSKTGQPVQLGHFSMFSAAVYPQRVVFLLIRFSKLRFSQIQHLSGYDYN